jgi:hypothetical protein
VIAEVQGQVEAVRGLDYLRPVAVRPITDAQIDAKIAAMFDDTYPAAFYARRTVAWRTIGVIPSDADLREALRAFLNGQVVGFYDPETGELVFEGSGDPGVLERIVLAHELTHAIDDQHFDLRRLDPLATACQDEPFTAALGLVEGSAQYFSMQVLLRSPFDAGDLAEALAGMEQPDTSGVPPFVEALEIWPYLDGNAFVTALVQGGGTAAVDEAMRHLPVSTEQVMHPERYPGDVPSPVDIGDLSATLGPAWGDLDAMQVGEEWLRAMLDLRLPSLDARAAATGWDGGVYRAWTDGTDVVVVLRTVWDSVAEADAFADAMREWAGDDPLVTTATDGAQVTSVFATSAPLAGSAPPGP